MGKVSHKKLIAKLKHSGVDGSTLLWIEDFLRSRTQVVVVDGEESDVAPVTSGVPQGTVLGPALFLVYINACLTASCARPGSSPTIVFCIVSSTPMQIQRQSKLTSSPWRPGNVSGTWSSLKTSARY